MARVIVYAEVPQFYAAVERARAPERPVIVGGDPRKKGLVQSASPEAIAAGVHEGMPMLEALSLFPHGRAVRTDMPRYREVSRRLLACLRRDVENLEPEGLAAVYADVSALPAAGEGVAAGWVARVGEELGLPLRAGIARTKLLARLAAQEATQGVGRVAPGSELAFLHPLPLTRLEGIGHKAATTLAELGAHTIGDVAALGRERLESLFGPRGLRLHASASGADDPPVRAARHPHSLSREATLAGDGDRAGLVEHLQQLSRQLEEELRVQELCARSVALKVRYAEAGGATTRSQALASPVSSAAEIRAVAEHLLGRAAASVRPIRGLGIQLGKLAPRRESDRQLDLFGSRR